MIRIRLPASGFPGSQCLPAAPNSGAVMFKLPGFIVLVLATSLAHAADPFPQGDPAAGKALVEKNCVSCHASMVGGDGSKIYTRPDHKVKTASALLAQVRSSFNLVV